jgi:integrase
VIYRRGKIYWYQFQIDGRRIRGSAKTTNKHVALQREAARKLAPSNGREGSTRNLGKFEDSFAEFLSGVSAHVKPRTLERYRVSGRRLAAHFGVRKALQICSRDIEDFKRLRLQECSNAGTNRDLAALRTFRNWCLRMGYSIGDFQVRLLREGPGNMRIVSYDEERAYMQAADQLLRDVATIIIECGLRPGEVFSMEGGHVNLSGRYVSIPFGKTRFARRTIPLTNKAYGVFARLWRPGKLFDGSVPHQVVMRRHKAVRKRLGFDFRLYDFRHTFGSRMAMAGVDLMTLRELMGHSSITITQRYCHPTPEHKLAAVAKLVEYNEVATKKPQSDLAVIQ